MRILADSGITNLHAFTELGELQSVPVAQITPDLLAGMDVLLVRSHTRVDAKLLSAGSTVRFVGSPIAGYDHLDTAYLQAQGIAWAYAPGCNAEAVVAHVLCAMDCMGWPEQQRVGILGLGQVGSRLAKALDKLGVSWVGYDPFVKGYDNKIYFNQLFNCDVLTIHTNLTLEGAHPSRALVSSALLKGFSGVLINTGRAAILEQGALEAFCQRGGRAAIDVWPAEPVPNAELVQAVELSTPHIAGYTAEARERGSSRVLDALKRWASSGEKPSETTANEEPGWSLQRLEKVRQRLNITDWSKRWRNAITEPDAAAMFESLRAEAAGRRLEG